MSSRHRRGQTIVIALLVLLLLAFVGGLFATIVTRNLVNAGRSNRVQSADYYAEAGIRFANDQLTASTDGADWRPPLQFQLDAAYRPKDTYGAARYAAAVTSQALATVNPSDPDGDYLRQGFARYNIGGGRYLLRVTYDPIGLNNPDNASATPAAYSDPRARYIRIESVGREGTVDATDPTTYTNASRTQLNATLIQYKAIGITDYARFETNPENRSDIMSLGVASSQDASGSIVTPGVYDFNTGGNTTTLSQYPIVTTYGAPNAFQTSGGYLVPSPDAGSSTVAATDVPGGGSIHVNGSVRFFGANSIYLNNAQAPNLTSGNTNGNIKGLFGETVEVAGNLLLDNYNPANALTTKQDAAVQAFVNADTTANFVYPSNDQTPSTGVNRFSTFGGAVRDGSGGNDAQGQPRSVNRLEPPTLDTTNPVTNLPRYAAISKNSPNRASVPTGTVGAAAYGYGQSIYVDNSTDVQRESSSLVGGYTLIDEWLHRAGADNASGSKSGWNASFYRPPGVDIVLGRQLDGTGKAFYGVRLTRSDVDGAGSLIGWKDVDGKPITSTSGLAQDGSTTQSTMTVAYDDLNASNDLTSSTVNTANPNNDVVISAEGNVRVHGVVSADPNDPDTGSLKYTAADDRYPRHVTIVTGGTAYIDGNLLRGNPNSSITVLAHDYVCVNTTQFLAGPIVDQNPSGTNPPGAYVGDPSLRALDFSASDEELIQEFNFGLLSNGSTGSGTPAGYPSSSNTPNLALYVSGGPSSSGAASADFDLVDSQTGQDLTNAAPFSTTSSLIQDPVNSTGTGGAPLLRTTFALNATNANAILTATQSQVFQLQTRRTPVVYTTDAAGNTIADPNYTQDFLLERAAILPMDIRIEAVLFAQTRSFFVIPGDWFNSDSTDTVNNYNGTTRSSGLVTPTSAQNRFPFFGQPIDMKITIDGAVSEARPADITAQSAWMAKWGWIPQFHGGLLSENAGHPNRVGLQIVYNPLAGFPYNAGDYLRTDIFGRPLPYAPKMPVCTGLLYAGQNTGESVLQ